jgi:hypothetical protein
LLGILLLSDILIVMKAENRIQFYKYGSEYNMAESRTPRAVIISTIRAVLDELMDSTLDEEAMNLDEQRQTSVAVHLLPREHEQK